jgi:lysyl-tRNA synthetase class 2
MTAALRARSTTQRTTSAQTTGARTTRERDSAWPGRLASWATTLVALAGLVGVVSGLLPPERQRLHAVVDLLGLPVATGAAAATVVLGLVLLLVARGLRRRRRRAWQVAVPLLLAGAALHVAKGLDVEEAALCLLGVAVLVGARDQFVADPDPGPHRRHPGRLFAALVLVSVAAGEVMLWANDRHVVGHPTQWDRLSTVLHGFVGLSGPVDLRSDRASDLVGFTLLALGVTTVVLPLAHALRGSRGPVGLTADDRACVRGLLTARPDGDSLGYFALRDDKLLVRSPSGKAAVSFRVESGVALASADPLGDPEAWPGATSAFLALAEAHGWVPAVLGCSDVGGTAWVRAGLSALELGDEAVVDVAAFTLEGRAMRGVRQAVARTERAGYDVRVQRGGDLDAATWREVVAAADSWRDGPVERGFSMALGRLGAPGDEDCVIVTARRDGRLEALLHFVPWGNDGLSLDLMRRARGRQADNGVNELLIVRALQAAPGLGVARVSLNFAVFRAALENGARLGAGPVLRAWRRLLLWASRFWQIESLYRFNAKFAPAWQPRYVCYRRAGELPRVLVAALQAEAFLPRAPRPPG